MKKIMLISIPHTGTVFVSRFFEDVMRLKHITDPQEFMETENTNVFLRIHTSTPIQEWKTPLFNYAIDNCHVVSPIRHPYENAVSCFAREHRNTAYPWMNWNIMMQVSPRYNKHFWVDIDTEHRKNMMDQLCEFIGRNPPNTELFQRYVNTWKKVNRLPKTNEIRRRYNETGIFPTGPNYKILAEAVQWYDKLKEELDKQYALADGTRPVASNHRLVGSNPTEGANLKE